MAKNGTGIVVTFASGFLAEIIDCTPPNGTREMIDCSHMGTTLAHEYITADLVEWGEASFDLNFDPGVTPPIHDAFELVTITFPDGETWYFQGAMSGYAPRAPMEDKMTATATIKVSGDITMTEDS
jgi:hypothetical protein